MTPSRYKRERERRGTQVEVAKKLGVHPVTLAKRETGAAKITREAWLALCALKVDATIAEREYRVQKQPKFWDSAPDVDQ